jgi:hypothetical protein
LNEALVIEMLIAAGFENLVNGSSWRAIALQDFLGR